MTPDDRAFLKQAFHATSEEPLDAGDPRYVDLTAVRGREDPIALVARTIELSAGESVQLFSGFPGTGKTTELHRLRALLPAEEYEIVFIDAEGYQSTAAPVAVPQVLIALTDGALASLEHARKRPSPPRFWDELQAACPPGSSGEPASIAASIKNDPSLWRALPSLEAGLDALVQQVCAFFAGWRERLAEHRGRPTKAVLILDSLDHVRGSPTNAVAVRDSVEALFTELALALAIPGVHLVFTVPPYLVRGTRSRWGSVNILPAVTVRDADGAEQRGGVVALQLLVAKRLNFQRLLGANAPLDRLIHASGGNLSDLLRLLRETVRRTDALSASPEVVEAALERARTDLLPVTRRDAGLLAHLAETHALAPEQTAGPHDLARWTEAHVLQLYRDGGYWYDLHPLARDAVLQQASAPTAPPEAAVAVLTSSMHVSFVVESYRALRRVRWVVPRGVSTVVGANGSGKTTLLDVPELLRQALAQGVRKALDARGGPGSLRSAQADLHAPVLLGVELDQLAWQLDLSPRGAAGSPLHGERATLAGSVVLDRSTAEAGADDTRLLLRRFVDQDDGAAFRPLVTLLEGYRLYGTYDLAGIRAHGSTVCSDEHLHPDGRNIFSVLRNWRDRRETRPRWDFVLAGLKAGFPDMFEDLDFETAGQTVSGRIVAPQPDVSIPTYFAANGWLVALLHLAAVASTGPAGVVAIDDVENGLHPSALRAVLDAMRGWAEKTGISVVLATHSPLVLEQLEGAPDRVFASNGLSFSAR